MSGLSLKMPAPTLSSVGRYPWFLLLNLGLLFIFVPPASALIFYTLAATLLELRRQTKERLGPLAGTIVSVAAVLCLTVTLLVLRDASWLPAGNPLLLAAADLSRVLDLKLLGLSYCWLRALFAFASREPLTLYEFTRYYFFFPAYFSGPVISPEGMLAGTPALQWTHLTAGFSRMALGGLRFLAAAVVQQLTPFSGRQEMLYAAEHFGPLQLWAAAALSGIWLYLNFSAFTDIYIGLARLMGMRLPENFDNPWAASDLTDFWRRWHISLGLWLRALVFSPVARLGGNFLAANSLATAGIAAVTTMIVCGLWHGLTWAYLVWGALHGLGLFANQLWGRLMVPHLGAATTGGRTYQCAAWLATHAYVAFCWVFFFPAGQNDLATSLRLARTMLAL